MSETEFVLFQNIIGGIETFLYAVCLTAFFYPFMTEKKERQGSKLKKILIVFGSYIAISLIGNFVPAYGWLGLMIVIILLTASSGYLGMNRNFTFFMGIIFRIFLFLIMLFVVGHRLGKQKIELQIRELCYLILTPIVAILFGNIIVRLWIVVKDDLIFQLYEQYPIFLGIVPVIAILFYAGILITIVSYQEMEKLQEEKKKHFIEEQQVHSIQERMEEVEQFYNGNGIFQCVTWQPASRSAASYSENAGTGSRTCCGFRAWAMRKITSAPPLPQTISAGSLPWNSASACRSFCWAGSG